MTILGSSSRGNCTLLRSEQATVLLDVGFSGKRVCELLEGAGQRIDDVDAVFLTHEHGDHAKGLAGVLRYRKQLPVFANRGTASHAGSKLKKPPEWRIFETGATFAFRDMRIRSFSVPHDALDPVGFVIETGQEGDLFAPPVSLAWCTDLGHVTQLIQQRILGADVLVLEANHDEQLLEMDDKRPWSLKQRIRSRHGHLSNEAAAKFLCEVEGARWQHVFLAHLSNDCNRVNLVDACCARHRAHADKATTVDAGGPIDDPLAASVTIRPQATSHPKLHIVDPASEAAVVWNH